MSKAVKLFWLLALFLISNSLLVGMALADTSPDAPSTIASRSTPSVQSRLAGKVVDINGPLADAVVRAQATDQQATSGEDGSFVLDLTLGARPVTITAAADGYYIYWTTVSSVTVNTPLTITLSAHYQTDNAKYDWFVQDGVQGSKACGECHTAYPQWQKDAHSQSALNQRFLSLYMGTDVHGNKSPKPKTDSMGIPQMPDLTQPYFGPGFRLDFPNRAGSCATCHTPMAAKSPNTTNCTWSGCHTDMTAQQAGSALAPGTLDYGITPIDLHGDAAEGISCEFCHKIGEVYIKRATGLPYPDLPGILSVRLFRPEEGHDLFFGPLDDVARADIEVPRDVHLPLMQESQFCAGCHYGVLGGVVVGSMEVKGGVLVYSSFQEWLESPYSDPQTGESCQDCHMPSTGQQYAVYPQKGGVRRDSEQIHTHKMLGVTDASLMSNALTLSATATLSNCQVLVNVEVTNDKTGHDVPTDSPLRHVMLIVEATGADNQPLPLLTGPRLPEWAGNYAQLPGQTYAKILKDDWSGEEPSSQIWRPVQVVEDTRIAPFATAASTYTFDVKDVSQSDGPSKVRVRLVYRRAFQQLMEWKGWNDPDFQMEKLNLTVAGTPPAADGNSQSCATP